MNFKSYASTMTALMGIAVGVWGWLDQASVGVAQNKAVSSDIMDCGQIVGWRGNGTGRFPDATPPLLWERKGKTLLKDIRLLADRPAGDGADGQFVLPGNSAVPEWLVLGPLPAKSIDDAPLPNEATAQPRENEQVGGRAWKRIGNTELIGQWGKVLYPPGNDKEANQVIYLQVNLHSAQAGKLGLVVTNHGKGAKIWFNGAVVHRTPEKRDHGHYPLPVNVVKGWNRLLIKLASPEGGYQLSFHLSAPNDNYAFESKNFAWTTRMPGKSNASPIVVGDRIFVTAEPDYLVCVSKKDGKVLWVRSHGVHECNAKDLEQKPNATQIKSAWAKVERLQAKIIADINAAVSPSGPAADQPVIKPATLTEKTQADQALAKLIEPYLDAEENDRREKMKVAWELSTQGGWAVATPCSDGQRVYVWFQQGIAACYNLEGELQWLTRVPFSGDTHHGYTASPVLSGGKFIVAPRRVIAFDARTGTIAWHDKQRTNTWGSLLAFQVGKEEAVVTGDGTFFRVADGRPLWRPSNFGNSKMSTAICDQGVIYDFMSAGRLVAMNLPRTLQSEAEWRYRIDITFPMLPSRSHSSGLVASPLYHEGLLYLLSSGGFLEVREAKNGALVYQKKLDMNPRVDYTGNPGCTACPTLAGKHIFLFDNSGVGIIIEPGRVFKQVARNVIENRGEQLWTTPVFDGKHMVLRTPDHLYCIGGKN
jgi:outer membrane protein assembly factor BamB